MRSGAKQLDIDLRAKHQNSEAAIHRPKSDPIK